MQHYNKLVRDKVPGTLRDGGHHVVTRTLRGSELLKALRAKLDEELAARISERRAIVAFRNILIHGYAEVDDRLVWDVVETKLPTLIREIEALLGTD